MTFWYSIFHKKDLEKLLFDAAEMIHILNDQIEVHKAETEMWKELSLGSQRNMRDLAIGFRVALEQPEVDLRDDLEILIGELLDSVAQIEEQVV